jgi:hypothetical protein
VYHMEEFSITQETLAHMERMGLRLTFAYHCNRCDYLWFPKDFDYYGKDKHMKDIFNLAAPRACARCKSKLWNKPRKRKMRVIKNPTDPSIIFQWVSLPRIKAVGRTQKRLMAQMENIKKELQPFKTQDNKTPVPTIVNRKKKKKLKV